MIFRENLNEPVSYFVNCVFYSLIGAVLGLGINTICQKLQEDYKINTLSMIFIQTVLLILILFFIETFISRRFAADWQNNTMGLFFVAFFFSLQSNLYENVNKLVSK